MANDTDFIDYVCDQKSLWRAELLLLASSEVMDEICFVAIC